jgi:hypothetical protein
MTVKKDTALTVSATGGSAAAQMSQSHYGNLHNGHHQNSNI